MNCLVGNTYRALRGASYCFRRTCGCFEAYEASELTKCGVSWCDGKVKKGCWFCGTHEEANQNSFQAFLDSQRVKLAVTELTAHQLEALRWYVTRRAAHQPPPTKITSSTLGALTRLKLIEERDSPELPVKLTVLGRTLLKKGVIDS